jgi:hypothetical protein
MARRILSVIKTETPYQINKNLVLEKWKNKYNFLNKLNHTREIDYKTQVVVLLWRDPQRQAGSYFIYSYNHTDAGGPPGRNHI